MHPILRITIGVVIALCRFIQPAHGFAVPLSRYHDYNDPQLYAWINIVNVTFYLISILLLASGIFRMTSTRSAS